MISKDDPLKSLYVDKDRVDRLRLYLALKHYIGIDKDTGDPIFFEEYYDLGDNEKMIIYLLYRRAIASLGHIEKDEIGIGIRDLSNKIHIDYNKVRTLLSEIESIENEKKRGRYFIPAENIEKAVEEINFETNIYYSTEENTKRIH